MVTIGAQPVRQHAFPRYPLQAPAPAEHPQSIDHVLESKPGPRTGQPASRKAPVTVASGSFATQFQSAYKNLASEKPTPLPAKPQHAATLLPGPLGTSATEPSIVQFAPPIQPLLEPRPLATERLPSLPESETSITKVASLPNNWMFGESETVSQESSPAVNDLLSSTQAEPINWWNERVQQPLHPGNQVQPIDSNWLVYMALENSPRIHALSRDPLIRDFEVIEADSEFDPVSFLQTQFADRSDPLGGRLDATRDGSDTVETHQWTADGGIRKKSRTGASYELSQRLGFQNSNVNVFDPNNQGTAQLALNVTQPLARGRGSYINQSQILIAQSAGGVAWETFAAELQSELESVIAGYWRLYYDRSVFLQKKRNVERVGQILATLEGRAELDSLPSQITRARSALQSRKTDLANAFRDVRDSETELRRLIADRNWQANQTIELLPSEAPLEQTLDLPMTQVVYTAMNNRPEIRETLQRVKIAGIQKDISVNDLLPDLSLLLGTYVSALQDDSRFGRAFVDQFGEIKPGYSVGLEFELPIGNRMARSRLVQQQLQLAKIRDQVDETIQNVIAEAQVSHRRLTSAAETLASANQAIEAARSDMQQNIRRWESFALVEGDFADGQTPTTVLDQLLDSQERLAAAELIAAQSQMELKISEIALQRTMGTLLTQQQVNYERSFQSDTPQIKFNGVE